MRLQAFVEKQIRLPDIGDITRMSLSRLMQSIPKMVSDIVRRDYNVKASSVKESLRMRLQVAGTGLEVNVDNKPIPFKAFSPRQLVAGGVTVSIRRGARETIEGAFIGGWIPVRVSRSGGRSRKRIVGRGGIAYRMKYVGERMGGHVFMPVGQPFGKIKKLATGSVRVGFIITSYRNFPQFEQNVAETFRKRFNEAFRYFSRPS